MRLNDRYQKNPACGLRMAVGCLLGLGWWSVGGAVPAAMAQGAKPMRAVEPSFQSGQFEGVFFPNPADQLQGGRPAEVATNSPGAAAAVPTPNRPPTSTSAEPAADGLEWKELISPVSVEDLVKGSKLRLDKIVTSPNAFKGGGFVQARTEFSLQAVLFAIIDAYAGEVRWKSSAPLARQRFARVAANTKVGSDQVFAEAKARLLDLEDLIGGSPLTAGNDASASDIDWSNLIDRVPLMQLLEWGHEQNLSKLVANEATFKDDSDAVLRYAELIAVLGKVSLAEEMPDASDDDYRALAQAMIAQATQVVIAAKTGNAEQARAAAAQIGQACTNCHDNYR